MKNTDIISNYIYIKMDINRLKKDIKKGYISKEQAWDYLSLKVLLKL